MAHEREQINTKRRAFSSVYGSKHVVRPAQIQYLDYHSAKLEDKYRELKELVATSVTGDVTQRDAQLLRYQQRVMRSLKLLHADTTSTDDVSSTYSAPAARPGELLLIKHCS